MEDRIIIAVVVALTTIVGFGVIATRKLAERQRFKNRQQGRGKSNGIGQQHLPN